MVAPGAQKASIEPIWFIKRSDLFKVLSEEEKEKLAEQGEMKNFVRGQQIYGEGDPGKSVYLVKMGGVKILTQTAEGKEITLAYLGEMELFGETAFVDAAPREQRAVATEDSCLLIFDVSYIESLMARQPALALSITKFVGMRLRKIQMRLQHLMFRTPRQRLAMLLLELGEDFGSSAPGNNEILINLRITHQEIASLIGVTRESVTYAMGELELDEMIRTARRRIFLTNRERLAELGR
ncbi:Crp/Fnr family transcriptional regulator [Candidatus Sumerlaeota bacterium]|nr:Crp/Fnr family transcriptional regulator [Candidatus Sumerlaeota bacterium]